MATKIQGVTQETSVRHELEVGKQVRRELARRTSEAHVFTRGTEATSEIQKFTWGIGRRTCEARYPIIHLLRHVPHLSAGHEMPHLSARSASRRLSENTVFDHPEFFNEPQILLEWSLHVFRSIEHNIYCKRTLYWYPVTSLFSDSGSQHMKVLDILWCFFSN